jgi:tRNA C32,U32 (ribose-2'-O)-methylase TrmJ
VWAFGLGAEVVVLVEVACCAKAEGRNGMARAMVTASLANLCIVNPSDRWIAFAQVKARNQFRPKV